MRGGARTRSGPPPPAYRAPAIETPAPESRTSWASETGGGGRLISGNGSPPPLLPHPSRLARRRSATQRRDSDESGPRGGANARAGPTATQYTPRPFAGL